MRFHNTGRKNNLDNKIKINEKEVEYSFKELSQRDTFELDKYYKQIFGQCIKAGLMTERQASRLYKKNGAWGQEEEDKITSLAISLNEMSDKIKDFDDINDESTKIMSDMIEKRSELTSLIAEKMELFRQTAEGMASQERMYLFIRIAAVDAGKNSIFETDEDLEKFSSNNPVDFEKILTSAYLHSQGLDQNEDITEEWEEMKFIKRVNEKEEEQEEQAKKDDQMDKNQKSTSTATVKKTRSKRVTKRTSK